MQATMTTAVHGVCATCGQSLAMPSGYSKAVYVVAKDNRGLHHWECWGVTPDKKRIAELEDALLRCHAFAADAGNAESHTSEERFGARMVGACIRRELDKLGL